VGKIYYYVGGWRTGADFFVFGFLGCGATLLSASHYEALNKKQVSQSSTLSPPKPL